MSKAKKPHFLIKNNPQKGGYKYSDILTHSVLKDICVRAIGCEEYTVHFDNDGYNKGRLAKIDYNDSATYVTLSEAGKIKGRNYFFQSLTTALIRYHQDESTKKRICFYFLKPEGSIETDYFKFMYRLMATAGFVFLNATDYLSQAIAPFTSIEDIIFARYQNRGRNQGNNSTYMTKGLNGITEIYGKTYGASKKETTLLCIVSSHVAKAVDLYEICEQDLTELPGPDLEVIRSLKNVSVIPTNLTMERKEFEDHNSLRSPRYIYNLLEKLGPKKCAFCDCEIPELVAGAHVWPVADIKKMKGLGFDDKLKHATDGDNGLWLCDNHHKILDENFLKIERDGVLKCRVGLAERAVSFIKDITSAHQIESVLLTSKFKEYLKKRNTPLEGIKYASLLPKKEVPFLG